MTNSDPFFRSLSNEALARGFARTAKIARYSLFMTLICFAAGIWIDAKWWPTALLPLAVAVVFSITCYEFRQEINRRIEERQRKEIR